MKMNTLRVDAGENTLVLTNSERDWSLLHGPQPFMRYGLDFIRATGVMDNYTVAGGIPEGSLARRGRMDLYITADCIRRDMKRDVELLSYDYSFRLTGSEEKHRLRGREEGFTVRGYAAEVDARPRGFCTLRLLQQGLDDSDPPNRWSRPIEIIDLRTQEAVVTDDHGTLRIYRKPAEVHWPAILDQLTEFLMANKVKEVTIHHV